MTIGRVRGWAISRLGLDRESFGLLRQGEFWEAMMAWSEDRMLVQRHEAEVVRAVGLRLFNLQIKGKGLKPHEFLPFPWDEDTDAAGDLAKLTPEKRQESLESLLSKVKFD